MKRSVLGGARYTVGAIQRLLNIKAYDIKFAFLAAASPPPPVDFSAATTALAAEGSRYGPRLRFAELQFDQYAGTIARDSDITSFAF